MITNIQGYRNIKGIILDVDGTLYYQTPVRAILIFLLVFLNFHNPKNLLRKYKVIAQYRRSQEILRKSSGMQMEGNNNQLMLTAETTGETPSYISKVIDEWFKDRPLPIIRLCRRKGMNESLDFWFENKFKLGVFSDYPAEEKLRALGISKFISTIVSTADPEVRGFKPRTNGFAIAAKRMGLEPSEILYIGDRPEVDGDGASQADMQVAIISSNFMRKRNNYDYPFYNSFDDLLKILR